MIDEIIDNPQELFAHISDGAYVITPNNRLSQQLIQDYFKARSTGVLEKPFCLAYPAFLQKLYLTALQKFPKNSHPIVLNDMQESHLWRLILEGETPHSPEPGLIEEIKEACSRCQQWDIEVKEPRFLHSPQTERFQQWRLVFQNKLKELGAISAAQIVSYLVQGHYLPAIPALIWVSFNDYTPEQLMLQRSLKKLGCKQYCYDLAGEPSSPLLYGAKDEQDEWMQIIQWLKARFAKNEQRIAVVVPDLEGASHRINRLLARHLEGHQYNISLGEAMLKFPVAAHALAFLTLDNTSPIPVHRAKLLLYSPYLKGGQSELLARAELIENCSLLKEPAVFLPDILPVISQKAPVLASILVNMTEFPNEAAIPQWIFLFKKRLAELGFPGDYPLPSATYQCLQRLLVLFDELLPLSLIYTTLSKTKALEAFEELLKKTIFQPGKDASPIQILGLLEAVGSTFDSIWVSGLTDQCLPQKTRLSAFIPYDLQREKRMPHALPEQELKLARDMLSRLRCGSKHSVFSYPRLTGDTPNLPSPLLGDCAPFQPLPLSHSGRRALVKQEEPYYLPLQDDESATGGTSLLANQAKCPFRAFAAHRLHAVKEPEIVLGFNHQERGQLMHQIMENLWQTLKSQQALFAFSPQELENCIERIIHEALAPYLKAHRHTYPPAIQEVEISRLKALVKANLEWEKERPPFEINALEKTYTMHLAGIEFNIRVDRIDTVGDEKWVIDYKTTLPAYKPWNEERPEEPQLLLYALLDKDIRTLLFLELKAGTLTCSGISSHKLSLQGISAIKKDERFEDKQQFWHAQLTRIAAEFQSGFCAPRPKRKTICERCEFQNLCRIEMQ
ncbi:PD-(D/E)XK nuclease family protein [Legionella londiniensis]|uniref:Recombinase B n=1 Tax=Legionella londiniensis TaxID=45068 RepID=A0A0W0VKS3_9GAMM|nr:PD-(D/E)XK nuclease family protein [Legionella londiniensis]KTD20688.1 recombinase B [Legionella londiniensis]STX92839.1 recombinase B [Legionella londiniensis]